MTGRALIAAALALVPAPAAACAVCLTSAFGDRSFNWAFVLLMLMPFALAAGIGGVLLFLGGGFGGPLRDLIQRSRRQGRRRSKPERQVARC